MRLTHEKMLSLTARMPMKQIRIPDDSKPGALKPYLHRYYAGKFRDGKDLWLHNFRSSDSERHLHSHPFDFSTVMLCGSYTEEYRRGIDGETLSRDTKPCYFRSLDRMMEMMLGRLSSEITDLSPLSHTMLKLSAHHRSVDLYDWHRITHTEQDTWTAVIVSPDRSPYWYFIDDEGNLDQVKSSPRDWHKNYNCRPKDGVFLGDNRKGS